MNSTRYGEPVGSTTVNSLVKEFQHTISKQIKITNHLSSVNAKHLFTPNFVPLRSIKLSLGFIFANAV